MFKDQSSTQASTGKT